MSWCYENGRLNGLFQEFYKNGEIKEQGYYKNGVFDGLVERWDENGHLKHRCVYANGKITRIVGPR